MSDEFDRKLNAYDRGELTGKELEAFERELDKLEAYQNALENKLDKNHDSSIHIKKQRKIMTKGKWKARLQTAFTALGIFILFTILSMILTAVYYSWGNPDRADKYRNIIDYTLTITNPYGDFGGTSTGTKPYFGLDATRDLKKMIGNETIKVGELEVNFLFSLMSFPEVTYNGKEKQTYPSFSHPKSSGNFGSDWNKLEKLPEGTVVSAYVSFDKLLESSEVEQLFSTKEMHLLWLAVDTGMEADPEFPTTEPIGFPSHPIWHEDDMIQDSYEEESGWFGSRIVSESYSSPTYHEGDQEMLHEQFMKTLYFLKDHEKKANQLVFDKLDLENRIDYLKENGIMHYGAVITGPTKEVQKLQDESIIAEVMIDEVDFWNWD